MAIEVIPVLPGGLVPHNVPSQFFPNQQVPVTTTGPQRHGVFRVAARTSAGTTVIATPDETGAIVVTDLVISTSKVAGSSMTVQFSDGVNLASIFFGDSVNVAINLSIGFVGLWRGWRDAPIELTTTGNVVAQVALGYMKVPDGLEFEEWDALR